MIFVDTNYFLRFLLNDINLQHKKAKELFIKGASGEIKLFTSEIVFFEIYWVLSSFYKKKKSEVVKVLKNVLKMEFIDWGEKDILIKAIEVFRKENIELEAEKLGYSLTKFVKFLIASQAYKILEEKRLNNNLSK